jgi:hypothetical protein
MLSTSAEIGDKQIIVHNDDETPANFVLELPRTDFGKTQAEANALVVCIIKDSRMQQAQIPLLRSLLHRYRRQQPGLPAHGRPR